MFNTIDKNSTWLEVNSLILSLASEKFVSNKIKNEIFTQNLIFSTNKIKSIINDWVDSRIKYNFHDLNLSTKYKSLGNSAYESKKYEKAANFYTKALFHAPKEGNLCAICHSNRAAALIAMGFFEEAFDDCTCALELGYENLLKIYYRQANCAIAMKNFTNLRQCVTNLDSLQAKTSKVSQKELNRFKKELEQLQESCTFHNNMNIIKDKYVKPKMQKVVSSNDRGRYVVADEAISENDNIMTEDAFAFVPVFSVRDSINIMDLNCMSCGKENIIPFPCYECLRAFYCSVDCRKKQDLIHAVECEAISRKIIDEIGIGYLAFKTLLIGFPKLRGYCNNTLNENSTINQIWDKINIFSKETSTNYSNVLNLITNFDKKTMGFEDYLRYSLTGTMLAAYLSKYTTFFSCDNETKCSTYNLQIVVAALITRHIGQMISNAHTIYKLNFDTNNWNENDFKNIWKEKNRLKVGNLHYFNKSDAAFTAIYPKISLYNHSCMPNFRNCVNKASLSIIANKNLNIGDEILNSYGFDCRKTNKSIRLCSLREQYHFICNCMYCKNVQDNKFKENRLLKCSNASCNCEFYPSQIVIDSEIWVDEIVYDNDVQINCPKCKTIWTFDWYKLFKIEIENMYSKKNLTYENLKKIYELYQIGNRFLNECHILKLEMALDIIKYIVTLLNGGLVLTPNWLQFLSPICSNMMKYAENHYGIYDLQYIICGIYCFDLTIELKKQEFNFQIDYDLGKIKKSFEILSNRIKLIFDNYFNDYIN